MGRETALKMTWLGEKTATGHQKLPPHEPPPSKGWTVSRKVLLLVAGFLAVLAIAINVNCVIALTYLDAEAKQREAAYFKMYEEMGQRAILERDAQVRLGERLFLGYDFQSLRDGVFLLLALIVASSGCIAYLVLRKVLPPIRSISQGAKEIASGRLDVTVPSHGKDEIAALGGAVNEIAANYQEVLLLTGTHAGSCLSAAKTMEKILKDGNGHSAADLAQQVALLKGELASIVEVVHGFRFYDARFNGREVVRRDRE